MCLERNGCVGLDYKMVLDVVIFFNYWLHHCSSSFKCNLYVVGRQRCTLWKIMPLFTILL